MPGDHITMTFNIYVRSSRIAKLPYYLTVQFMRFEWRADSKMKAKIVKPIEFPMILDVYDLCTPGNSTIITLCTAD